ncbi:MAG: gliding motility-associated C-terminal domain-containing protein [Bacteroidota bacterium]|nr:gliding motility-associated C-terminal domain-containing protein [Bacteroidota bacterium]
MKRILIIIFLLSPFLGRSQMISSPVQLDLNCYHDGAIFLNIMPASQVDWYFEDDSLGWIDADTMLNIQFSNNLDTLIAQQCGNYKVVVAGDTAEIFVNCPLGSRGAHLNVQCFGDSTGMLKRVAHSGSPPYFYKWFKDGVLYSSGDNDTLFENLEIGSYKIVFTDSIGCSDSILANVVSPSLLIIDTIFTIDINCRGINSGSVSCSVYGGRQYTVAEEYDYYVINLNSNDTVSWLTRDSISSNISSTGIPYQITFDSLFAGEYILSVVDSFDCILDTIFEIKEPEDYITFGSTTDILICESDSGYLKIDGVVGDSVLGSDNIAFGFAYDIINGIHLDSIYASSGWYDIYVYDSTYFCLDTVPIRCEALYEIEVFENITSVLCFGDQSGSVIIDSIIGGNTPYDVQWGGVNNAALFAGTYSVHFVDAIFCLHTETYVISQGDQINPNEVLYHPFCNGDVNGSISIDITGGTGQPSYYWLNGSTADSLYGLADGIYTLIVTDSVGCSDTSYFSLQSPQLLEVDLIVSDSILPCFEALTGINAMISGGTVPYSINWGDGDTNQQRIIGAGYYEIEITDTNGCSSSDSIVITGPDSLAIEIELIAEISCTEGATVTITVSGGAPFPVGASYTYLWSGPNNFSATTSTIDSLSPGTYIVFVSDTCGFISDTIHLNNYELNTVVHYDTLTHIAEVEIVSTTSLGPFGHEWLDTLYSHLRFPSYDSISPFLCGGYEYFVTTIDSSNNCSVTNMVEVPTDTIPLGIVDLTTTTVDTVNLANLWGSPPYEYLWNDSLWSTTFYGYPCPSKDSSWVDIKDNNDCKLPRYKFLIDEIIITLDPASEILECDIENLDIDLTASATGGTGTYSFEWWNGSIENPINLGMSPGNFSVTVTDANGCKTDTSFVIATITSECVPNVFTPNSDGTNDTWSLEDTFLYEDSKVRIYGRFGKLLFQSVGYHDKWDGTNEKGNDVPDGVYFYVIEIGHGFDKITGTVTILR